MQENRQKPSRNQGQLTGYPLIHDTRAVQVDRPTSLITLLGELPTYQHVSGVRWGGGDERYR